MSGQRIDIPVQANVSGATSEISKVERAVEGVADAIGDIGKESAAAAAGVAAIGKAAQESAKKVEAMVRGIKDAQSILSKELGKPVNHADAATFLHNFESLRSANGLGSRRVRPFQDFGSWYAGHSTMFATPQAAAQHRRMVMSLGLQGTSHANGPGAPTPPGPTPPGPTPPAPHPNGPSPFGNGVRRAQTSAMSFGRGALALAGIGGVAAMASSALDSATEESVGLDTLKRRLGDLGVSFDALQQQTRGAAAGMGMTYVESSRLAQQFASTAGRADPSGIGKDLHTAYGFSRGGGMDPNEGVQFFGTMRRLGVTGDDQQSRRLALMIASAVDNSKFAASADEIVKAVADFATNASRLSLSVANVGAFASNLSGMTSMGVAGLDPGAAAGILQRANGALARGGAYGEASMVAIYSALSRANGGAMNPWDSKSLQAGGLFGTADSVFGDKSSITSQYYDKYKIDKPKGDTQNFAAVRDFIRQQYKNNPRAIAEALGNTFGVSYQEGMALDLMEPKQIDDVTSRLEQRGINWKDMNPSGIFGASRILNAQSRDELTGPYREMRTRGDISSDERSHLNDAYVQSNTPAGLESLRNAMLKIMAEKGQTETDGSKTRQSISDLKNELTRVGSLLFIPLNAIRDAVVFTARATAPEEWRKQELERQDAATDYAAKYRARGGNSSSILDHDLQVDRESYERFKKKNGRPPSVDDLVTKPREAMRESAPGQFQETMARRQALGKLRESEAGPEMRGLPAGVKERAEQYLADTDRMLGLPPGTAARQIFAESGDRNTGLVDPKAVSEKGAMGLAQIMPDTAASLAKRWGVEKIDPYDVDTALRAQRELMGENMRASNGDAVDAARRYNGGWRKSRLNNPETNRYISQIFPSSTNVADIDPNAPKRAAAGPQAMRLVGQGEISLVDQKGREIGTAGVKGFAYAPPAGADGMTSMNAP